MIAADVVPLQRRIEALTAQGGTALLALGGGKENLSTINALLPVPIALTARQATMLAPKIPDPWTQSLGLSDLYFAEDATDRQILQRGLTGPFVAQGRTLLEAANSDWSLFEAGEAVKVGALMLYEQLQKPGGAALVVQAQGKGHVAVTTLRTTPTAPTQIAFWRKLLANMGVKLNSSHPTASNPAFEGDTLIHALSIGRFGAATLEAALAQDFLASGAMPPTEGTTVGGLVWHSVSSPSKDRFQFPELNQRGPERGYAVYFSFWIQSPRALDDLLGGGPETPRVGLRCFVSSECRLLLNGKEAVPAQRAPADYRTLYSFESLPLKRGWNHVLIKVAADQLQGDKPGTLAARLFSSDAGFLQTLDSTISLPSTLPRER
ncbi:MAG: glycoside hydrolase family 2 [Chthonomonadales bacterium]|nr:glycoside hydrolase family 2 [Chthonomonadales bacterium]